MHEFLTYFLSHRPSNEEWIAFLLVNVVAYLAARNTVLRRERRAEMIAYQEQLARLEAKRSAYRRQLQQEQ